VESTHHHHHQPAVVADLLVLGSMHHDHHQHRLRQRQLQSHHQRLRVFLEEPRTFLSFGGSKITRPLSFGEAR
jgi:hypothetical protein